MIENCKENCKRISQAYLSRLQKTVADRGAFKMILVSGSKDKDLSYLNDDVIHDTTTVKVLSRNVSIQRKTLRTLVEMYDYSCKTSKY